MNLTKPQIKALKGKCPECIGMGIYDDEKVRKFCKVCQGSGKSTISIPKEWVDYSPFTIKQKEIQKYKVGEEISICPKCGLENYKDNRCGVKPIKLKIISETEDEQTLVIG